MIVLKFGMQKRKPSESFQFLSFGIFGRYKTWFYLRMSTQMLVYAVQKTSTSLKNLIISGGRILRNWSTSLSLLLFQLLVSLMVLRRKRGCGMVLKLNDQHYLNLWMG